MVTSRARAALSRATLVSAAFCFALFVAECATRSFTHVVPPLDAADATVGKTYARGFTGTVYVDECDCDVFLRFNREGFRGPDRPYDKEASTRRVAVIGDSMIAAIATVEEDTLVSRLEDSLNGVGARADTSSDQSAKADVRGSDTWEVMNFGVSGAGTAQELVLYGERIRQYHPDVVVLGFFLRNDVVDNSPRLGSSPYIYFDIDEAGRLFRVRTDEKRSGDGDWVNRHSRFYVWQKLMLGRMRGRWGRLDRSRLAYLRSPDGDVAHAWEITRALLTAFHEQVTADGASFIVAALPAAEAIYDDVWTDLLARSGKEAALYDREFPERKLTEICSSAGIPLVTMAGVFRAAAPHASSKRDDERLFWQGIGHFDPHGNALAAAAIANALLTESELRIRP